MYKLFNKLQAPTVSVSGSGSGSVPTDIEKTREELVKKAVDLRDDPKVLDDPDKFYELRAIERILADEYKLTEYHNAIDKDSKIDNEKHELKKELFGLLSIPTSSALTAETFFGTLTNQEKLELEMKDKKINLDLLSKDPGKKKDYAEQYFAVAARERILASPEKLSNYGSASNRNEIIEKEIREIKDESYQAKVVLQNEQKSLRNESKTLNAELNALKATPDPTREQVITQRKKDIKDRLKDIRQIINDPAKLDEHAKNLAEEEKKRKDAEEKAKAVTAGTKIVDQPEPSRDLDDEYRNSKRKKNEMIDEMNFQNQKALRILSNSSHSDNWIVQMFNAGHRLGKAMPFILKGRAIKEEIEGLQKIEAEYDKYGAQANMVQSKLNELKKSPQAKQEDIKKCELELNRLKDEQTRVFDKVLQVRYQHIQQTEEYNKIHPKKWYHTEAERVNMFVEPGQQAGGIFRGKRSYASRALSALVEDPIRAAAGLVNPLNWKSNVESAYNAYKQQEIVANTKKAVANGLNRPFNKILTKNTPADPNTTGNSKVDDIQLNAPTK